MPHLLALSTELLQLICDCLIPDAQFLQIAPALASPHASQQDLISVFRTCKRLRDIAQRSLNLCPSFDVDVSATRTSQSQARLLAKYRGSPKLAGRVRFVSIRIEETETPDLRGTSIRCTHRLFGFQPIPEMALDSLLALTPNVTCLVWRENALGRPSKATVRGAYLMKRLVNMKSLEVLDLSEDRSTDDRIVCPLIRGIVRLPNLRTLRITPGFLRFAVRDCMGRFNDSCNIENFLLNGDMDQEGVKVFVQSLTRLKSFSWTAQHSKREFLQLHSFFDTQMKTLESMKFQPSPALPLRCSEHIRTFNSDLVPFTALRTVELPLHMLLAQPRPDRHDFSITIDFPPSLETLRVNLYQGGFSKNVQQATLAFILSECLIPRKSFLRLQSLCGRASARFRTLALAWSNRTLEIRFVDSSGSGPDITIELHSAQIDNLSALINLRSIDILYPSSHALDGDMVVAGLHREVPIVSRYVQST